MNWNLFVTELVAGITHGSVYALIALGYSMVYGILKLLNFAHGDIYMVGAFIGYGVLTVFGGADELSIAVGAAARPDVHRAMLGGGLLGVSIERFAYRRLRNAPRIAPLITALGVSFFLENAALLLLGAQYQSYNTLQLERRRSRCTASRFRAGVHVELRADHRRRRRDRADGRPDAASSQRTQLGKAMRATSFDREAAAMMGIDVDRVIVATFFIGSALAGAAGVFNGSLPAGLAVHGLQRRAVRVHAAVVGGIGSLPGAVLGGLLIGLAEAFAIGYISSTFQDAIVFAILIAVMIVRPSGLLGRAGGAEGLMSTDPDPDRPTTAAAHRRRRVGRVARGPPRGSGRASSTGRRERSSRGCRSPAFYLAFGVAAATLPLW